MQYSLDINTQTTITKQPVSWSSDDYNSVRDLNGIERDMFLKDLQGITTPAVFKDFLYNMTRVALVDFTYTGSSEQYAESSYASELVLFATVSGEQQILTYIDYGSTAALRIEGQSLGANFPGSTEDTPYLSHIYRKELDYQKAKRKLIDDIKYQLTNGTPVCYTNNNSKFEWTPDKELVDIQTFEWEASEENNGK